MGWSSRRHWTHHHNFGDHQCDGCGVAPGLHGWLALHMFGNLMGRRKKGRHLPHNICRKMGGSQMYYSAHLGKLLSWAWIRKKRRDTTGFKQLCDELSLLESAFCKTSFVCWSNMSLVTCFCLDCGVTTNYPKNVKKHLPKQGFCCIKYSFYTQSIKRPSSIAMVPRIITPLQYQNPTVYVPMCFFVLDTGT